MKRIFVIFSLFSLAGCLEAEMAFFVIEMKNACNYPVQLTVPAMYIAERPDIEADFYVKKINFEENEIIFSSYCIFCISGLFPDKDYALLKKNFPEDYTIKIEGNGRHRTLNSEQFLEVLKGIEPSPERAYHWTIKDASLCP
jgi:hypothetical protein